MDSAADVPPHKWNEILHVPAAQTVWCTGPLLLEGKIMENFSTVSKRNAADYVSYNTPVLQQPQLLKLYLVECK